MAESEEGETEAPPVGNVTILDRFRAWESLLIIFFGGYYMGKDDPMAAAMKARDFLIERHRAANDESGARAVEKNFEAICQGIEYALDVKAGRGPSSASAFLHLVPPPESRDSSTVPPKGQRRKAPAKRGPA